MQGSARFLVALSTMLAGAGASWAATDVAVSGTWTLAPTLRALNSDGIRGRAPGTEGAAVTIYDSFTGAANLTATTGSPRTYMASPFVAAGPGTIAHIEEATVYLRATATFGCSGGIDIRIQVWDSFDGGAVAVFSNAVGAVETFTVPGPLAFLNGSNTPINVTFPVARDLADLEGGWAIAYRCDNGAGLVSDDAATSWIRGGGALAVGSFPPASGGFGPPQYGFYRNVAGQTNFNHLSSDLRTFVDVNDIALVLQLRGSLSPVELLSVDVE